MLDLSGPGRGLNPAGSGFWYSPASITAMLMWCSQGWVRIVKYTQAQPLAPLSMHIPRQLLGLPKPPRCGHIPYQQLALEFGPARADHQADLHSHCKPGFTIALSGLWSLRWSLVPPCPVAIQHTEITTNAAGNYSLPVPAVWTSSLQLFGSVNFCLFSDCIYCVSFLSDTPKLHSISFLLLLFM